MKNLTDKLKKKLLDEIDSLRNRIIEISDIIHDHPELGSEEYKAVKLLTSELKKHGYDVEESLLGMDTAFRATYKGRPSGPNVAIITEYDALPEIGHACGHNIIAAAGLGAAIVLSKVLPELRGTLMVLGTPAEEGHGKWGGSKVMMAEKGVFNTIDAAIMIHPSSRTSTSGTSLADHAYRIQFTGKAAHAAASPHKGINALDAVMLTFAGINALRQHVESDVRIHGIITDGGFATNIIPEFAAARVEIRAPDKSSLEELVERVKNCARGAAHMTGAKLDFRSDSLVYLNMIPNQTLAQIFEQNLKILGIEFECPLDGKGSTDLGNVSHVVPTNCFSTAIGPKTLVGHTRAFAEAAVSEEGRRGLIVGTKVLALTAIDLFINAKLLANMKEEFKKRGVGKS